MRGGHEAEASMGVPHELDFLFLSGEACKRSKKLIKHGHQVLYCLDMSYDFGIRTQFILKPAWMRKH